MSTFNVVGMLVVGAFCGVISAANGAVAPSAVTKNQARVEKAEKAKKNEVAVIEHKVDLATAANILNDVDEAENTMVIATAQGISDLHDIEALDEGLVASKSKDRAIQELEQEVGLPTAPFVDSTTEVAQKDRDIETFNFDDFERMLRAEYPLLGDEGED